MSTAGPQILALGVQFAQRLPVLRSPSSQTRRPAFPTRQVEFENVTFAKDIPVRHVGVPNVLSPLSKLVNLTAARSRMKSVALIQASPTAPFARHTPPRC